MTANPFDPTVYDDCGFDISHNNGTLDFNQLAIGGLRKYCICKLTEGEDFIDPQFPNYMSALIASPIDRYGVYHFAHHGNPIGQMDYFIAAFRDWKNNLTPTGSVPDFLFMLDLERSANPPLESDGLAMVQYLQNLGIQPMVYCGYDYWSQNWPTLDSCSCMVAAYNDHPISPIPWRITSAVVYGFDFWQYEGDYLGPWAKDLPGGSHGMDLSCFNLAKYPQGFEVWWDAQLAATKQPS